MLISLFDIECFFSIDCYNKNCINDLSISIGENDNTNIKKEVKAKCYDFNSDKTKICSRKSSIFACR